MIKKAILLFPVILALFLINACQSENEADLYGKDDGNNDTLKGEIAYFSFADSLADAKGNVFANLSKKPEYVAGIGESEKSALKFDGTEYLILDLGRTFDTLSLVFFLKNDNDVNSGYLPYLVDCGFGFAGARLDLDAVSSATYLYVSSDTASLPAKENMQTEDRINTRNGWALFYFELTKDYVKTTMKFSHPMMGNLTVTNNQNISEGNYAATQIITIGKGTNLAGDFNMLVGSIDELHIFNGVLTNKQLNEMYKGLEE
jgi:hypothetical protein